jgi:hypothetical protein
MAVTAAVDGGGGGQQLGGGGTVIAIICAPLDIIIIVSRPRRGHMAQSLWCPPMTSSEQRLLPHCCGGLPCSLFFCHAQAKVRCPLGVPVCPGGLPVMLMATNWHHHLPDPPTSNGSHPVIVVGCHMVFVIFTSYKDPPWSTFVPRKGDRGETMAMPAAGSGRGEHSYTRCPSRLLYA